MIHAEAREFWLYPTRNRDKLTELFAYSRQDIVALKQLLDKTKVVTSFVNFAREYGVSITHMFMF